MGGMATPSEGSAVSTGPLARQACLACDPQEQRGTALKNGAGGKLGALLPSPLHGNLEAPMQARPVPRRVLGEACLTAPRDHLG